MFRALSKIDLGRAERDSRSTGDGVTGDGA
ncbi:hypothetical protein ACVWZX_002144 [Deinococcus sp. UYEF24]